MLEIVAKRAALRTFDPTAAATVSDARRSSSSSSSLVAQQLLHDPFESDVSSSQHSLVSADVVDVNNLQPKMITRQRDWIFILCQFLVIYACILYFAFISSNSE